MRIFLLEDDEGLGTSLTGALEIRGHAVTWERTVLDAHAALGNVAYDRAILDFNLPDGKGTDVLPLEAPTVVCSGLPDDVERELARREIVGVPVLTKGVGGIDALLAWLDSEL